MRKIITYMLLGVASMASAEFQGNVLLRGSVVNLCLTMALYAVLSCCGELFPFFPNV